MRSPNLLPAETEFSSGGVGSIHNRSRGDGCTASLCCHDARLSKAGHLFDITSDYAELISCSNKL